LDLAVRLGIPALAESVSEPDPWTSWSGAKADRCRMCYRLRLDAAARKAAELGLTAFTTTLLISPWQNHEALIEAGSLAASRHQVLFLYQDMRSFYREGQKSAREDGLYRQRYCGCLPSIEDSFYRDKIRRDLADLEAKADQSSGSSAGET
jgi:predicted adenine nucleotide alpha hydrolase (AANH) superfamily ATPase